MASYPFKRRTYFPTAEDLFPHCCQAPTGIALVEETHLLQGHTSFQGQLALNDIKRIKAWPPCVSLGQL